MKVTKFGGSSLANAFQIQKVCNIVLSDPDRRIMVVSAPGKRTKDDTKVTDLLIAVAKARLAGNDYSKELAAVLARYEEIADELNVEKVIPGIEENLKKICAADYTDDVMYLDSVKAMGEDSCARLVAYYLNASGHKAKYCDPSECGLYLEHDAAGKAVIQSTVILPSAVSILSMMLQVRQSSCLRHTTISLTLPTKKTPLQSSPVSSAIPRAAT